MQLLIFLKKQKQKQKKQNQKNPQNTQNTPTEKLVLQIAKCFQNSVNSLYTFTLLTSIRKA